MKITWWRGLALALMLLAAGVLAALTAVLQPEPTVAATQGVNHEDVARAMSLLRAHDPREARPGVVSSALVHERDVEVLLNHAAHRWLTAASRVRLQPGRATLQLSTPAPRSPYTGWFGAWFGRWLNVELQVKETATLPVIDGFRIGRLPLPAWLAERVGLYAVDHFGLNKELLLAAEVVRRVRFSPQQVLVTYAWQGNSMNRLLDGLLTADELTRLRVYSDRLAELVARQPPHLEVPMVRLLGPLFALARERGIAGNDPANENRAVLVTLTLYANGRAVASVAPAARSWPRPRPTRLMLAGRADFPLHFLVSATLAAEGTTPLTNAIGVYKEVADSRGGSGFSFNDMAANRAGTRFGERAVKDPLRLQDDLAQLEKQSRGLKDGDLLPRTDDLPEFMAEAEFLRRFGGVGAPGYNTMLMDIDRRIAALPLLR